MAPKKATGAKKAAPSPDESAPSQSSSATAPKVARTLRANVVVDGKTYGPAHPENVVTDEIAEKITNPRAWS